MLRKSTLWVVLLFLSVSGHADVIVNNNNGSTGTANFTQSGASVLTFGSTVIVSYNDSGSFTGGASKFTGYSRSTDGGITFTDMGTLPTNPNGDAGFANLARDNTTGAVYMTSLAFNGGGLQVFRSSDGGVTFGAPVAAAPGVTGADTNAIAVDNFAGAGNGAVYVAVRDFGPSPGIKLYKSTDGGATFGPPGGLLIASTVVGSPQAPSIAIGPDHSVTIAYFEQQVGAQSIKTLRSTDGGATFGAPVTAASLATTGTNGNLGLTGVRQGTVTPAAFRSNAYPQVVVNPVSGHLYMVYANKGVGADKGDIFMVVSTDNGASWSPPTRVNTDAGSNDQWQPTIAISPDGKTLGIFWYDRREDAVNNLIHYYGRQCGINGAVLTCTADFAISDRAFLPEFGRDSVVNSVSMGDFDHATADNSFFYVAWGDNFFDLAGGGGRKDPNVFFDRITIESIINFIPEPAPLWLMALGLLALGRRRVGRRA